MASVPDKASFPDRASFPEKASVPGMANAPDIAAGRLPREIYEENFSDLHPALTRHEALVAAERCLFCYDAPCVAACPTSIDIPLFIRQISTGNLVGSAKTILDANIMGGMCARVCPTESLCEGACVRMESESSPVEIGLLQRHATDALLADGRQLYRRGAPTGKHVAVVGAGPAGLACAHKLATLGHEVTLFDAREKPGGLNEYGIAAYKTPDDFAQAEVAYILDVGGITLKSGQMLGRDMTLTELRAQYDAVFLGLGLGAVNTLGIDEGGLTGIEDAVSYIARLRQTQDLSTLPVARRIVVIGGGSTAIDIATQSMRLGAEQVTIAYRRGPEAMSATDVEQHIAQTNGVLIRHWLRPHALLGADGRVTGITLEYTREEKGKLVGTWETTTIACNQVFRAIGQAFVPEDLRDSPLEMRAGKIAVDETRRTSLADVWAGGDCIAGGLDLTVAAVEDGKQAALAMDRFLRAHNRIAAE